MQTQQTYVDALVTKYNVDYKQAESELFRIHPTPSRTSAVVSSRTNSTRSFNA